MEDTREDGRGLEVRWDEANMPRLGLLEDELNVDGPEAVDKWEDASIPREGLEPPRVKPDDSEED